MNKYLIARFATISGYKEDNIRNAIQEGSADKNLTGYSYFCIGFEQGVEAVISMIQASQPPEQLMFDCVDLIKDRMLTKEQEQR